MEIIDFHCDALLKLQQGQGERSFANDSRLDTNKERLQAGKVKVQCFAIFIEPNVPFDQKFQMALKQVDYYYKEILQKNKEMKHLSSWEDFDTLQAGEIGTMLTLEGVDAIGDDLTKLHILRQLGVLSVGLTWNHANLAADGALEPRGAGLTTFGKEVVRFLNQHGMLTDVSHLCEKAFWDVMEEAHYPFASHSNAKAICNHPRNVTDDQARALFQSGGTVHVVYHPPFINENKTEATISDLIAHIDHFCALGGVSHVGLGSDFDGISTYVTHLEHAGKSQNLINELLKYYSEEQVRGFASTNFLHRRPTIRSVHTQRKPG
ncbi:dipeptidase Bdp [Fictibacillus macauensis ZFHKF-1]|uniref:Dipeptidase Bdp n=1 Tax=Fictibacillus macauensis ZFHKF-1 TaxID=1196324 RepID=I8IZ35_9BACL|nr:dipeptidase [Fictibacillus macauensis]EIT84751.1 dipeptidase Bdp [Fictibacillus macauensis ZFHKF-1]